MSTFAPSQLNDWPTTPFTTGTIVGGDAALATSDGGTSYAEISSGSGLGDTAITFSFGTVGVIPAGAVVSIEADWWTETDGAFQVSMIHPTLGSVGGASWLLGPDVTTHAYGDPESRNLGPSIVEAYGGTAYMDDAVGTLLHLTAGPLTDSMTRVTRLTLKITLGITPPLRLMQRGDGIGMGSGRVFGAGTRQGSIRVFGSL